MGCCSMRGENAVADDAVAGKTVLLVGATSGIGLALARIISAKGAVLVVTGRRPAALRDLVAELKAKTAGARVYGVELDLMSLDSVRRAARAYAALPDGVGEKLNVLILNAGIIASGYAKTADGIEKQMGVNHFGNVLLTDLLMDTLKRSAPARVVVTASEAHRQTKMTADNWRKFLNTPADEYGDFSAYANAKMANVMHAQALAERYGGDGITAFSLHPGVVSTSIARDLNCCMRGCWAAMGLCMMNTSQGAATTMHCAFAPGIEEHNGRYFKDRAPRWASGIGRDVETSIAFVAATENMIEEISAGKKPAGGDGAAEDDGLRKRNAPGYGAVNDANEAKE